MVRYECSNFKLACLSRIKDLCMTDDLLKEETGRLVLFSTSSDGDLRGWAFNPENVRIYLLSSES